MHDDIRSKLGRYFYLIVVIAAGLATPAPAQAPLECRAPPSSPPNSEVGAIACRPEDAELTDPLRPDQPVIIRLGRHQTAFFRIAHEPDAFLEVATSDLARGTDTVLTALGDGNVLLMQNDDSSDDSLASQIEIWPGDGARLIRAETFGGNGGGFTLRLARIAPRAIPLAPFTLVAADAVGPLIEGEPRRIRLLSGQKAIFRLPTGRTDSVVETRNLALGTDTVLDLLDEGEQVLASDDDGGGGLASRLRLSTHPGAKYVRARLISDRVSGEFDLAIAPASPLEPAPAAAARSSIPGLPAPNRIAEADPTLEVLFAQPTRSVAAARTMPALRIGEFARVALSRQEHAVFMLPYDGRPFTVLTFGLSDGADTILELIDAEERVLRENDDDYGSLASRIEVEGLPGPFFLRVRLFSTGASRVENVSETAPRRAFNVGLLRSAAP